jgi:iron only hydrogenase large subunit-like protein
MNASGYRDVDYVLTTRELGKMINSAGIDFNHLPDDKMDSPIGMSSGAADIFANTGGVMEAAIRTAYEIVTGKELPLKGLHVTPLAGLEGIKEASLKIEGTLPDWSFLEGVELKVAVAHGLNNARALVERIVSGKATYHFVEVMTCPGGCIGGGGQPRFTDNDIREKRMKAIFREDEGKKLRKSHENPEIKQIYKEYLEKPLSKKSHHLLHTTYQKREVVQ